MSIFAEGETKLKNGTKVNQSSMVKSYLIYGGLVLSKGLNIPHKNIYVMNMIDRDI